MSQAALCLACRDALQTALSLNAASCDVGFDGQPKPSCGQEYLAVHPGLWQPMSGDYDLHEAFGVNVTITRRIGYSPKDRWGVEVWSKATDGLNARARLVIAALHQSQAVRAAANVLIPVGSGASGPDGFFTPLLFKGAGSPELKGYDWFGAPPPKTEAEIPPMGVALTLIFAGAERVQTIGGMA